jgi:uncharacterized membrane protein YkvA (DUF1232 family)
MNLKQRIEKLKINIPAIFLALGKKETPVWAKILAWLTVAYALSPIDLIPDFIPVLGYLDDLLILPVLVTLTIKLIPKDVFDQCLEQSKNIWKEGKPSRWYFSIGIVILWIIIIFIILKFLFFKT